MSVDRPRSWTPRRLALLGAGGLIAAVGVSAFAVWFVFFSSQAPGAATIDQAAGALSTPAPGVGVTASAAPTDDATQSAAPSASTGTATGVDGTWTVDTSVGSFADYTSAWAGFRVNEVLDQIGETVAIGRTPDVTGTLTLRGTTLEAATIEVDLTTIRSDRERRDGAIQRALETASFPTATFELTEPVDLGAVPADRQTVAVDATGTMTIHGTSQPVTIALQAQLVDDSIVVVGSTPITFSDFGVTMPTAPIVVSVEDDGIIEFQLFFTRA
jgi:polyisoprenoid-binding protein YceI